LPERKVEWTSALKGKRSRKGKRAPVSEKGGRKREKKERAHRAGGTGAIFSHEEGGERSQEAGKKKKMFLGQKKGRGKREKDTDPFEEYLVTHHNPKNREAQGEGGAVGPHCAGKKGGGEKKKEEKVSGSKGRKRKISIILERKINKKKKKKDPEPTVGTEKKGRGSPIVELFFPWEEATTRKKKKEGGSPTSRGPLTSKGSIPSPHEGKRVKKKKKKEEDVLLCTKKGEGTLSRRQKKKAESPVVDEKGTVLKKEGDRKYLLRGKGGEEGKSCLLTPPKKGPTKPSIFHGRAPI